MESIKITFPEQNAQGIRKLTIDNWSGCCLIVSRDFLQDALETDELEHAGIYILHGPPLPENGVCRAQLYIGKSESLGERLASHSRNKEMRILWNTAFLFMKQNDEGLHAGQIAFLEASLIEKARKANRYRVHNLATPTIRNGRNLAVDMKGFLSYVEQVLFAVGQEFLVEPPSESQDATVDAANLSSLTVATELQAATDAFRSICNELPDVTLYETHVPDLRARVTVGSETRVFARVLFRKKKLCIESKGNQPFFVSEADDFTESYRSQIREAYELTKRSIQ